MDAKAEAAAATAETPGQDGCWQAKTPEEEELSRLLRGLKEDPLGACQLGVDGVMRSFTADREIIDAIGLTNAQIKLWFARMPASLREKFGEKDYEGVDGTSVSRENMYSYSRLPPPMPKEKQDEYRAKMAAEEKEQKQL